MIPISILPTVKRGVVSTAVATEQVAIRFTAKMMATYTNLLA